jgi:predicted metal-dependent hydrolase
MPPANEVLRLGDVSIAVLRKDVNHVHLSVYPPSGRVTLTAPKTTRPEVLRAYVVSRLGWIRDKQSQLRGQARAAPRRFVERESHYVWGRRRLLSVRRAHAAPSVRLSHRQIILTVRPGASVAKRDEILHQWYRALLHEAVPRLIRTWQPKLGVRVAAYFLQRMKTKWGSCNHRARTIRLNTELAKKPRDLLEYVVVHEMIHLIVPTHSEKFTGLLNRHYPSWREARAELDELPLTAEFWRS